MRHEAGFVRDDDRLHTVMTQAEAAGRLGVSVSGMKARVQRGRRQLKELLLDCCDVELDRRGGVNAYRSKRGSCATCGRR